MIPLKELYSELLALTQLYMLQQYPNKGSIPVDINTYTYFKQIALQQKSQNQKTSPVVTQMASKPAPSSATNHQPKTLRQQPVAQVNKPQERVTNAETPSPIAAINAQLAAPQTELPPTENKPETSSKATTKDKTVPSKAALFVLEPITSVTPIDFSDIRQVITERFPSQKIIDQIPNDEDVRKKEGTWQKGMAVPEVLILSFTEIPKEITFLQNIAKAIQDRLSATAQIMAAAKLEQEECWSAILSSKTLRLIIACDHGLPSIPGLMQYYREAPRHAKYYAGKVPLCLMSDISLYLNEPQLKPALWKTIQEMLKR